MLDEQTDDYYHPKYPDIPPEELKRLRAKKKKKRKKNKQPPRPSQFYWVMKDGQFFLKVRD